jgi:hypothetical protein
VHALSNDELTIKSVAKTYRFKAADVAGKAGAAAGLQEVGAQITRLGKAPALR